MANGVRTRKDVWKLATWDPILKWYAAAIAEMQRRPISDPRSWRYQAAIHDYVMGRDPNEQQGEALPGAAERRRFWAQCQHFSWFFLPWHRMYLLHFERIVADAVVSVGGPAGWALPYWNYSDTTNANARRIPPAFREERTPTGEPNPLLIDLRNPGCNIGDIIADPDEVDLEPALTERNFSGPGGGGGTGFGGPRTGFNHGQGQGGVLEGTPHGSMHVAVGGWMGRFNTAGLDPLFWLHHANIDRLWSVWRARDAVNVNPTDARWLTGVRFEFHDAAGNIVVHTSKQVVETTAVALGYQYEDITDPIGVPEAIGVGTRRPGMERQPEMVGATEESIVLAGGQTSARIAVSPPTGPALEGPERAAAPPRVYLNVENVTGAGDPTSYAVYLNLPPDADPAQYPDRFAGIVPMFGVAEATRADDVHAGEGLHYTLEISKVVRALQARNEWDPNDLRVTFVLRRRSVTAEGPESARPAAIDVGRISLYFG